MQKAVPARDTPPRCHHCRSPVETLSSSGHFAFGPILWMSEVKAVESGIPRAAPRRVNHPSGVSAVQNVHAFDRSSSGYSACAADDLL
jgi:hypothetical protein